MNPSEKSILFFGCLMSIFPLMGNSRNDQNLLVPTGMFGQPNKKGIAITKVEPGSPADGRCGLVI